MKQYHKALFLSYRPRTECSIILYILRFSHHLLCEKAFRILLRPITEAKRVSYTWKNRFVQSQTTVEANCVFAGFFAVIAGSFVGQLWEDNIFGVLELFVIQTYQELGGIFEDGWAIKKICVSRQTYRQVYRRPKKQEPAKQQRKGINRTRRKLFC